jgi:hypothetical protein
LEMRLDWANHIDPVEQIPPCAHGGICSTGSM